MNQTLKAISERYSCRNFNATAPSDEQLQQIAVAAVQAPSAMNLQRWRAIVVKNEQLINDIEEEGVKNLKAMDAAAYDRIIGRGNGLFYHTKRMIIVPIEKGGELDCGIIVENIAIAAKSLGVESLICGLCGLAFAGDKAQYFKDKLQFPAGYEYGMAVLLGFAVEEGAAHEPDMSKIINID